MERLDGDANGDQAGQEGAAQSSRAALRLDFEEGEVRKRTRACLGYPAAAPALWTPNSVLLASPDVKMLKFNTPEIERFLDMNNTGFTPTPGGWFAGSTGFTPGALGTGRPTIGAPGADANTTATREQLEYVLGFDVALQRLHGLAAAAAESAEDQQSSGKVQEEGAGHQDHRDQADASSNSNNSHALPASVAQLRISPSTAAHLDDSDDGSQDSSSRTPRRHSLSSDSAGRLSAGLAAQGEGGRSFGGSLGVLSSGGHVKVKQEPLLPDFNATNLPAYGHAPLDMAHQERVKLERKRLRNRLAASKCRRNKLEKIATLEEQVITK